MNVFIGYDSREDLAYQVSSFSIKSKSADTQVIPLKINELKSQGIYTRGEDKLGSTEFTFSRENAGLGLTLKVSKIDDNGFVTMNVNPEISVPIGAGTQGGVPIYNIAGRKLQSGSIRLRDRQTLIISGVISESQEETITKWPLLGDLPLLGSLFRGSTSRREKEELVVVVSPQVIDDEQGGIYGYGYKPVTKTVRRVLNSK